MINLNGIFNHAEIMKFAHARTKEDLPRYPHKTYAQEFAYRLKLAYIVARQMQVSPVVRDGRVVGIYQHVSTLGD